MGSAPLTGKQKPKSLIYMDLCHAEFFGKVTKILLEYRFRPFFQKQSTKLSTDFGDNLKNLYN